MQRSLLPSINIKLPTHAAKPGKGSQSTRSGLLLITVKLKAALERPLALSAKGMGYDFFAVDEVHLGMRV